MKTEIWSHWLTNLTHLYALHNGLNLKWEHSEKWRTANIKKQKYLETTKQINCTRVLLSHNRNLKNFNKDRTSCESDRFAAIEEVSWLWGRIRLHPLRYTCARSKRLRAFSCPFLTLLAIKQGWGHQGCFNSSVPAPVLQLPAHKKTAASGSLNHSYCKVLSTLISRITSHRTWAPPQVGQFLVGLGVIPGGPA